MTIRGALFFNQALVYIARDRKGACMYVGMSRCGIGRPAASYVLWKHRQQVSEIEFIFCRHEGDARQLEKVMIRRLRPKLNALWHRRSDSTKLVNHYAIGREVR